MSKPRCSDCNDTRLVYIPPSDEICSLCDPEMSRRFPNAKPMNVRDRIEMLEGALRKRDAEELQKGGTSNETKVLVRKIGMQKILEDLIEMLAERENLQLYEQELEDGLEQVLVKYKARYQSEKET